MAPAQDMLDVCRHGRVPVRKSQFRLEASGNRRVDLSLVELHMGDGGRGQDAASMWGGSSGRLIQRGESDGAFPELPDLGAIAKPQLPGEIG